jgi:hypothetical protein
MYADQKSDAITDQVTAETSGVSVMAELRIQCRQLRRAGQAEQALDLANAAMVTHPKSVRPYLEKALSLTEMGQNTALEIQAWWDCIEKFLKRVRPNWFERLRDAVEKQAGNLRFNADSKAVLAEIERIHAIAQNAWPKTDSTDSPSENVAPNQVNSDRVHEWF